MSLTRCPASQLNPNTSGWKRGLHKRGYAKMQSHVLQAYCASKAGEITNCDDGRGASGLGGNEGLEAPLAPLARSS
eukprot:27790-Pleurochrysis_carterae.AAC.1